MNSIVENENIDDIFDFRLKIECLFNSFSFSVFHQDYNYNYEIILGNNF